MAAVAIPLMAGGTLYARQEGAFVRAATPAAPIEPVVLPGAGREAIVTGLAELPPPTPEDLGGTSPWQPFLDYALEKGAALAEAGAPQSALLVPDGLLVSPQRRPCPARYPAVILDLDTAKAAFDPASDARPPPGLAAGLARLREAGIVVLWLSRLPAARVGDVANAVRAAGLDPEGKDQFLLLRGAGDRPQALREEANRDVCVVAIAGDERADFDELFDYLRNPAAAIGLDAMLGDGWFLLPPPLAPAAP